MSNIQCSWMGRLNVVEILDLSIDLMQSQSNLVVFLIEMKKLIIKFLFQKKDSRRVK